MTHNYKPGDVALVEAGCHANRVVALRTGVPSNMGWAYCDSHDGESTRNWSSDDSGIVTPVRPLLVIDPESYNDRMRLIWNLRAADLLDPSWDEEVTRQKMQAALRSLLEPEPEEPTAWLAVVRDGNGDEWYRYDDHGHFDPWTHRQHARVDQEWSDLPRPITVLSEGWQESTDE